MDVPKGKENGEQWKFFFFLFYLLCTIIKKMKSRNIFLCKRICNRNRRPDDAINSISFKAYSTANTIISKMMNKGDMIMRKEKKKKIG